MSAGEELRIPQRCQAAERASGRRGPILVLSFLVAGLGYVGYRIMTRGQRIDGQQALTAIAGAE
jgi:hypothetical protein